jgi:hypothetical protein
MTATEAEMFALADHLGLHVARHRLNGRPRYRFFAAPMDFAAGEGMGTVIGTRAALTWLRGYEAARSVVASASSLEHPGAVVVADAGATLASPRQAQSPAPAL